MIVTAWTSVAAGRIHHRTSPAAEPNVPGATGAYPTPNTVATSSAGGRRRGPSPTGGREPFSESAITHVGLSRKNRRTSVWCRAAKRFPTRCGQSGAHDASAGEPIVESAVIAADDGRHE